MYPRTCAIAHGCHLYALFQVRFFERALLTMEQTQKQLLALLRLLEVDRTVQSHLSLRDPSPEWDETQLRIHRADAAVRKAFPNGGNAQYTASPVLDKKTKIRNEYVVKLEDLYHAQDAVRLAKPWPINLTDAKAAVDR